MDRDLKLSLFAGALSGVVGAAAFIAVHTVLLVFAPFLLPFAPAFAAVAGLAVGWAWHELRRAWRGVRGWHVGAFAASLLLPATLYSLAMDPGSNPDAAFEVPFAVVFAPGLIGALVGAALTRSWRGAISAGAASFLVGFGFGAQISTTSLAGAAGVFLVALLALLVLSGVVLERVHAALVARSGGSAGGEPPVHA